MLHPTYTPNHKNMYTYISRAHCLAETSPEEKHGSWKERPKDLPLKRIPNSLGPVKQGYPTYWASADIFGIYETARFPSKFPRDPRDR